MQKKTTKKFMECQQQTTHILMGSDFNGFHFSASVFGLEGSSIEEIPIFLGENQGLNPRWLQNAPNKQKKYPFTQVHDSWSVSSY